MLSQATAFLAWHYTSADRFLDILRRRALLPSVTPGGWSPRPVVWFSINPEFERSSLLGHSGFMDLADGNSSDLASAQGDVRIGVPIRTLLTCADVRRLSAMSEETWARLCEEARALGSDPDQWFASTRRIPLDECIVEVRAEDGSWRRMQTRGVAGSSLSAAMAAPQALRETVRR